MIHISTTTNKFLKEEMSSLLGKNSKIFLKLEVGSIFEQCHQKLRHFGRQTC